MPTLFPAERKLFGIELQGLGNLEPKQCMPQEILNPARLMPNFLVTVFLLRAQEGQKPLPFVSS